MININHDRKFVEDFQKIKPITISHLEDAYFHQSLLDRYELQTRSLMYIAG